MFPHTLAFIVKRQETNYMTKDSGCKEMIKKKEMPTHKA